jgi:hypothetical protein
MNERSHHPESVAQPCELPQPESFARFCALVREAGVDLGSLREGLLSRMRLLASITETVADCDRAAQLARCVFAGYAARHPVEAFSPLEQRTVIVGGLFSDIGKTGPTAAGLAAQRVITEIFGVENVPTPNMSLYEFLLRYFPSDADARAAELGALAIPLAQTMRSFWNCHSTWTLEIIDHDGVPAEAVAAAATHHLLENVNPGAIVAPDGRFTRYFGENYRFDRPEKLVIVLDKYDAARRRAGRDHAGAVRFLRDIVGRHPRFGRDVDFRRLIDDVDSMLADVSLYGPD